MELNNNDSLMLAVMVVVADGWISHSMIADRDLITRILAHREYLDRLCTSTERYHNFLANHAKLGKDIHTYLMDKLG